MPPSAKRDAITVNVDAATERREREPQRHDIDAAVASLLINAHARGARTLACNMNAEEGWLIATDDGPAVPDLDTITQRLDGANARKGEAALGSWRAWRGAALRIAWRTDGEKHVHAITLEGAHFRGEQPIIVEHPARDSLAQAGTAVAFALQAHPRRYREALKRHARHAPITVTLDGDALERADFLEGAVHREECPGYRLAVFRDPRPAGLPNLNALGALRHVPLPELVTLDRVRWCVRAELQPDTAGAQGAGIPANRLSRPALDVLHKSARRALFHALAAQQPGPWLNRGLVAEADSLRITLHEPPARLRRWTARDDEDVGQEAYFAYTEDATRDHLLVPHPCAWPAHTQIALDHAARGLGIRHRLLSTEGASRGFSWSRHIPIIRNVTVVADGDRHPRTKGRPETITLELALETPAGARETLRLHTDFALRGVEGHALDSMHILVTRNSTLTREQLEQLLYQCTFFYDPDATVSGSWHAQQQACFAAAREAAARTLLSPADALRERLAEAVRGQLHGDVPPDLAVDLRIRGRRIDVTLHDAAAAS